MNPYTLTRDTIVAITALALDHGAALDDLTEIYDRAGARDDWSTDPNTMDPANLDLLVGRAVADITAHRVVEYRAIYTTPQRTTDPGYTGGSLGVDIHVVGPAKTLAALNPAWNPGPEGSTFVRIESRTLTPSPWVVHSTEPVAAP